MFLNYIKDFSVKRILKNNSQNTRSHEHLAAVKTVGVLVDESYFSGTKSIVASLITYGIEQKNIEILLFKNKIKKNKKYELPSFGANELNWNATLKSKVANDFINKEFDLLINYYEIEKAALLVVSHLSRAKFTVGFSTIDKRFNDLVIKSNSDDQIVFINEIFKYLKLLNKI